MGGTAAGVGGMGGGTVSSELDLLPPGPPGLGDVPASRPPARRRPRRSSSQTGEAVVTIGGFNGSDPAPTAAQLAKLVADGELYYVLIGSEGGAPGGCAPRTSPSWVQAHGTAVESVSTDGMTLYHVSA